MGYFLGTSVPPGPVSFPLSAVNFFFPHCILNALILTEIKCMEKINDLISARRRQKKYKSVFDLGALKKVSQTSY